MPPLVGGIFIGDHVTKKDTQLDKFKQAALELECDDDEARFKEKLGKLVKPQSNKKRDD